MNKFKYYNHKELTPVLMAEIQTESILDADEAFKKQTGLEPVKCSWIGVTIEPIIVEKTD